jgi:hypothetical protein
MKLSRHAKAIAAAVVAGASALGTALGDGTVTATEGFTVLLAVLGGLGITWAVPNRPAPPSGGSTSEA